MASGRCGRRNRNCRGEGGGGPTGEWTTVYLIERSLSLDNVFLFSLLIAHFLVPAEFRGRVIVIGIAGALVLRGIAIAAGLAVIESVEAVVDVFGALLLYVAYRAFRGTPEESDPSANPALRLVRRTIPITTDFRGRRLFVREEGRLYGTRLLLVIVAIIAADIAFAVDSIPAAFAVTRDRVVISTANAFAPRAWFPARARRDSRPSLPLRGRDDRAHPRVRRAQDPRRRPRAASLAVIATLLAGGIFASLVADHLDPPHATDEATRRPPRCPRELKPPEATPSRQ